MLTGTVSLCARSNRKWFIYGFSLIPPLAARGLILIGAFDSKAAFITLLIWLLITIPVWIKWTSTRQDMHFPRKTTFLEGLFYFVAVIGSVSFVLGFHAVTKTLR
jgi:hypothetical protein